MSNAYFLEKTSLVNKTVHLGKTHPISRVPAIGYVKQIRMLSVLHIGLVESFPALCLPSVMPCRDWGVFAQNNRSLGEFYDSFVFDQHTRENWKWGTPFQSQESIVIYLSKPTSWQTHEMILWPIASICPKHFIKNVQEKLSFLATLVFFVLYT